MSRQYSNEYVQFIRNFIINNCYIKYSALVNEKIDKNENSNSLNSMNKKLVEHKNNEEIWKKVMKEYHIPIKYLTNLFKNTKYDMPITNVNVFKQQTFQEYIDEIYKNQGKDPRTQYYSQFVMTFNYDNNYKQKTIEKYHDEMYRNVIKNYIIYVIQMYLSKTLDKSRLFTDKEIAEMELSMNLAVYLDYSSTIDWEEDEEELYYEDDVEDETYQYYNRKSKNQKKYKNMEEEYNYNLEKETITFIHTKLGINDV